MLFEKSSIGIGHILAIGHRHRLGFHAAIIIVLIVHLIMVGRTGANPSAIHLYSVGHAQAIKVSCLGLSAIDPAGRKATAGRVIVGVQNGRSAGLGWLFPFQLAKHIKAITGGAIPPSGLRSNLALAHRSGSTVAFRSGHFAGHTLVVVVVGGDVQQGVGHAAQFIVGAIVVSGDAPVFRSTLHQPIGVVAVNGFIGQPANAALCH